MFKVGDKVFYPMHGAGVIEAIEEKEFLGERHLYYIMRLPIKEMKVMVPVDNVKKIGVRPIVDEKEIDKVLVILGKDSEKMSANWNHRYRANMEKMKTGKISDVAEVVRNLATREQEKGLSTGEKKILDHARQILVSEMIMAKGMEEEKAVSLISEILS